MNTTIIWIVAAVAAVAVCVGVVRAARRSQRTFVPATPAVPATTSVPGPVEEVLESPQHAADTRAGLIMPGPPTPGAHRRVV